MEIVKGTTVITDTMDKLIETEDGNVTCGCGNPKLRANSFIDEEDFYSNTYQCSCGNFINVRGRKAIRW